MYRYAQILNDKVHHIMEHEANIDELYNTYFSKEIIFVDITGKADIQEGWNFDGANFSENIIEAPSKADLISQLDSEYQPQFAELSQSMVMATLADNANLITEIKADYTALKTEYEEKRTVIESGS